ncbi:hypothetical protein QBC33DRAFT_520324 [Phialemonium atrogriseum]|uniref:F-box domain-containing protein n=1 Tax=Phialemonium atrogriseum TaxID=1093897 RepID=A0AAJ0C8V0_9PEZI|nr:uncharacterized protein QBC33DRAFT_520324 [Phialemonium atrogriseum]KAK1772111.1 hypothetical protein QBC33DRAFT_520324 [Phialemonium atrogriseum]
MDPFATLPNEILLFVVQQVPDLGSLHNLRSASPAVASLIREDGNAARITEAVLSATLPDKTQEVVRTLAFVLWGPHSGGPPLASWSAFRHLYHILPIGHAAPPVSEQLPREMPSSVLCRVLALSTNVHRVAHGCLHTLMNRFLSLRPRRPAHPRFNYRRSNFWKSLDRETRQPKPYEPPPQPPSEPAKPSARLAGEAAAPLAWVEEQSALNAAWRLALISALHKSVDSRQCAWPSEDVEKLKNLSPVEFWDLLIGSTSEAEMEWVRAMSDYIGSEVSSSHLLSKQMGAARNCCMAIQAAPDGDWIHDKDQFGQVSAGYSFFREARTLPYSPLRGADFGVFRQYGFGLWSTKRMMGMALLPDPQMTEERFGGNWQNEEHSLFYSWYSILTAQELVDLEDTQRTHWPN